ncbi:unnamed protein product [Anisakis simplex]|uniref:LD05087p (inferred by orthology to a D. melanogaster protein) n=1 Tax=Anisakis simplex TaxID=6269 RepID=A0A0M3J4E8_ANISI|nr:unnamed protein product [Anisakis simplex]
MVSNGADSKAESISKETKSRPQQPSRMPYFKRISLRKKLNPLAIGLKSRMDDEDAIDFYREILLRGEDIKKPDETQEFEVDIETLPAIESDEVVADNPAIVIACALNVIQPRPTELNDESGEKEEIGLERIHNLASKENDLRRQSLRKVFNIISSQYTAELATEHVMGGASIQYNTLMKNSYRLRDSLPIFSKTRCDAAKWTHKILIECLPVPMLATYISLLRFCKTSSRPLVDLLVGEETDDEQLKTLNSKLTDFIFDRVTDPQTASISRTLNVSSTRCSTN